MVRLVPFVFILLAGLGFASTAWAEEAPAKPEAPKELFTGKVVLLGEALKRKGIESTEEMHRQAVLETEEGEILPLVADWRGWTVCLVVAVMQWAGFVTIRRLVAIDV